MRPFPRAARRRLVAATSVAALALGTAVPLATQSAMADELKDRQKRAQRDVSKARSSLDDSSAQLRQAQGRLDRAQAQLSGAQAALATARGRVQVAAERDAQMQAELDQAEARLAAAEEELAQGRRDLAEQQRQVVDTITGYYQQGDPELEAFASLVTAATPEDLTRSSELRDNIVGRETAAFDALRAAEVMLEVRERQVQEIRDDVEVQRAAAAANLAEQEQAEADAEEAKADVAVLVGEAADARGQANRARAADLAALQAAQGEADKIAAMLERRAAAALRAARGTTTPPSGGFLGWPTAGPVTSPFGMREHPIYHYYGLHDGVDFAPGCGATMVAAASGTVVSSYWSDVYGHRLVIDHGAVDGVGLATIYNHASSYTVGVGARVERGQTIGYVGNSGWSTGCHLHFTVMANGSAVAPFNWM